VHRRVIYSVPDDTEAAVRAALAQSACPVDAEVRILGGQLVSITTEGPWVADDRGYESGLGVPGWELVLADCCPACDPLAAALVAYDATEPIAR